MTQQDVIQVGVSSCLLGEEVRFDGGHKRDRYVQNVLGEYFRLIPVCPEVAVGLGIPRQPIHLAERRQANGEKAIRVVGVKDDSLDVTQELQDYADQTVGRLGGQISGYILKSKSPSCGMARVKVYSEKGMPGKSGPGAYAERLMERLPNLPVEEEGRLNDDVLRENFIQRVYVYHRWQKLVADGLTPASLVDFHTRHKLMVLAHDQPAYRRLGRLVASAGERPMEQLAQEYETELMQALKQKANRRGHANVLYHLMGYLKMPLDSDDRLEIVDTIEQYRRGKVPLVVPLTLLQHHFRRHPHPYVDQQYYLNPHPKDLMLRNTI